jgi:hypothetical protein
MIDIQDDHGRGGGGPATLATVRVLDCEPQRSSLALPFSEIGWNEFSKNRVKPLLLLDTGQQRAFSQSSRTQVAN